MTYIDKWQVRYNARFSGYDQDTSRGNHVTPCPYRTTKGWMNPPPQERETSVGSVVVNAVDVPNLNVVYDFDAGSFSSRSMNKAYASLVEAVRGTTSQLGMTLAQGHKSFNMITQRASQMYQAYRRLRRGNFRGFLRELRIGPYRRHRNMVRNEVSRASGLWLEYSYGWVPLMGDMYNAAEALQQPVPGGTFSGSGTQALEHTTRGTGWSQTAIGSIRSKCGATVFVVNPNAYLLQQLGVANPLLVLNDLVPFSFVVDWVFDYEGWLSSFTDFVGCEIHNAYHTSFLRCDVQVEGNTDFPEARWASAGRVVCVKRQLGLPRPIPNFSFRENYGTSWKRAANAVSLLGSILAR